MNTQSLSTLQEFQTISHKCKCLFLQSCPKEFIRFLCECIINLLKGNLQSIKKRHHVTKFQSEGQLLFLKRTTWKLGSKEETFWRQKEGYSSINLFLLPSITIGLNMEQFVLVPASVYNKNLITQSVTKQELPKYQPSRFPTYQVDLLKKEMNKNLFSKADSSVDKILSCQRIKLSNSQTLISDGVETGTPCWTLRNDCVVKTRMFPTFTLVYLTPLVYPRL